MVKLDLCQVLLRRAGKMKFYFPILPVKINQCKDAKRLCTYIPNKRHFNYVLNFLQENGYIKCYYSENINKFCVFPKYMASGAPVLTNFRVVTKPSSRYYVGLKELKSLVYNRRPHLVHYIISTREGFMTVKEALAHRIGGEVIYEI